VQPFHLSAFDLCRRAASTPLRCGVLSIVYGLVGLRQACPHVHSFYGAHRGQVRSLHSKSARGLLLLRQALIGSRRGSHPLAGAVGIVFAVAGARG